MADPSGTPTRATPPGTTGPTAKPSGPPAYCFSNNEFTPQQTMRGKTCLLGYLYSLGDTHK